MVVGAAIFIYIIYSIATKGFFATLNMNMVIFMFVGIQLYFPVPSHIHSWKHTPETACIWQQTLSFGSIPMGTIMGMMYVEGGLEVLLSLMQSYLATAQTMPIFSFLSACVVNLFIPSPRVVSSLFRVSDRTEAAQSIPEYKPC